MPQPAQKSSRSVIWFAALIFALTLSACNLSQRIQDAAAPTDTAVPVEQPTQGSQIESQATDKAPEAQPTETSLPSQTPAPVYTPTESPAFSGIMAFVHNGLGAYTFTGSPSGFNASLPDVQYLAAYNASVYKDGVAFPNQDGTVRIVTAQGSSDLAFIHASQPVSVAVSADGTRIAWTTQDWPDGATAPESALWVANMDGSSAQQVTIITAAENAETWLVYHPVNWLPDGRLLFATQPSGIGGYILYGEWNSLHLYDPASGSLSNIVAREERLGLAVNSVSHDLSKVAISANGIQIRDISTQNVIQIPALADQNTCGSARFSPDDQWIAYGCGRNNPDNEAGQIMLARADGSAIPVTLYNKDGGAPQVAAWINNTTLLFSTYDNNSGAASIWRVDTDGSNLVKLVEGSFVGLIPNP